jgi:hypothetical protein
VARKAVTKAKVAKPRASKTKSLQAAPSRDVATATSPEVIPSKSIPGPGSRQWILGILHQVVAKSMRGETGFNGSSANAALKLLGQEEGMFVELKRMSIDPLDGLTREEMKQLNDYLDRIAARLDFKSAAAPVGGAAQPDQDPA